MNVSRLMVFSGSPSRQSGMSLAEIMVVLGVLVVLIAVAVPSITHVLPSAREATAKANLEELNQAVFRFNHANWDLALAANEESIEDELAIVRSLQFRSPVRPAPGSPYLEPILTCVASDLDETHRAAWNGRVFQLISPGVAGTGLDLARLHDGETRAEFADNYQPVGAP